MFDPQAAAAAYRLVVEIADLGAWTHGMPIAEYDSHAAVIRINERALADYRRDRGGLGSCDVRAFIDRAVAHELYHHREAMGEIARLPTRALREQAAEAFARALVPVDSRLDAFLKLGTHVS